MKENGPERAVEVADTLLHEKMEHLARDYPPHLLGMAARNKLLSLQPQLEEALRALAEIERRRNLTAEELARRRAFRTLFSVAARLTGEAE